MFPKLLRFKHLKEAGIVENWPQLRRMQELYGFPAGFLLSPNARAWREDEIGKWLAERPTEPSRHVMERAEKSVRARQVAVA